ncbi:MAG: F0F1 ATP synthase subunit epsilon [Syntrophales bacterium]|nr:F0F1 ATP synthase subunit epsilon [Syntrophales bacterium]PKN60526.1 MAG: ATP synthase F1 subunit epsilon [Deltaproteobacteria bacterium HGW-Deltaproteobacteria-11]
MADELILEIVTPEKMAFSGKIEEITIPGTEGEFGVLRGHASLLSSIETGELSFFRDGKRAHYAVSTGYAEVTSGRVTVLVETAERSDMIDKERAKRAREIAETKINKLSKEDDEREAAKAALAKANVRLNVAEKG